jgi:hypothetical protein
MGAYAHKDLSLQIKTSSGDTIDLGMFQESSASYSETNDSSGSTKTTELSFSQGYKLHYEGNGISEQDQKEIADALKKFKPEIDKFMGKSNGNEDAKNSSKPEDWLASLGSNIMPTPKDDNTKNMQKSEMAKMFDDVMKNFKPSEQIFNDSKRLLDKIFGLMDGKLQIKYA